jgi:hypothetical protein
VLKAGMGMIVDTVNPFKEDGVLDTNLAYNAIEIEKLYFAVFHPLPNECKFIENTTCTLCKLPAGHVEVRPTHLNVIRTLTQK